MKHGKSKFFMLLVLDILVLQCAVCTYIYVFNGSKKDNKSIPTKDK